MGAGDGRHCSWEFLDIRGGLGNRSHGRIILGSPSTIIHGIGRTRRTEVIGGPIARSPAGAAGLGRTRRRRWAFYFGDLRLEAAGISRQQTILHQFTFLYILFFSARAHLKGTSENLQDRLAEKGNNRRRDEGRI